LLCAWAAVALAQSPPPLVRILSDELDGNFGGLREKGDPAPYYMAYAATDMDAVNASAVLEAVKSSGVEQLRVLDIAVRVGTPKLDNYHRLRGEFAQFTSSVALPIEDSDAAIQRRLWLGTDRVYRLRGLEFRSLNARSLKDITAASDQSFVVDFLDHNAPFAVMGGASFVSEASVVAPSVLVDDVELEPLPADYARPPIVPAPQLT
jgi:hypothetical protein